MRTIDMTRATPAASASPNRTTVGTTTQSDVLWGRGATRRAIVIGVTGSMLFGAAVVASAGTKKSSAKARAAATKVATSHASTAGTGSLQVSTGADRSNAVSLAGATVAGPAYIFFSTARHPDVIFTIDGGSKHFATHAPFDLVGGTASAAMAFGPPTASVQHTVKAQVFWDNKGGSTTYTATFTQLPDGAVLPSGQPTGSPAPTTAPPTTDAPTTAPPTTTPPTTAPPTTAAPTTKVPTSKAPSPTSVPTSAHTVTGGTNAGGALSPGSYDSVEFTGHVVLTKPGSYSFSNDIFDNGVESGAFRTNPVVHVSLNNVEITNTSGTPGAPDARGIAVLPGATVVGTSVTVHHTLGDGIGVLGGVLTLTSCRDYDNYGGAPLNTDHVDGMQVTSGTANLTDCVIGETPSGAPSRTGNIHCKGDAGPVVCNLNNVIIAGYGGRIALNYEVGTGGGSGGEFNNITVVTAGSIGVPLDVRPGTNVSQGSITVQ
jgi:hypothetical protein